MSKSGITNRHPNATQLGRCLQPYVAIVCYTIFLIGVCTRSASMAADDVKVTQSKSKPNSTAAIAFDSFDYPTGPLRHGDQGHGWKRDWKLSRSAAPKIVESSATGANSVTARKQIAERVVEIRGTGARNNPLRRELEKPLTGREVFVRFDLRYLSGNSKPDVVDPEFMVLWMDRLDGADRSTHAANVPNIGLHVADRGPKKGRTVFMVRIGPARTSWSKIEVQKDHTYQVVARLSKSKPGDRADYDRLEMWIDPTAGELGAPDATVSGAQSISVVQWIGFSTGVKTEASDRIHIDNLLVTDSWESVIDGSARFIADAKPRGHNGVVWKETVDFKRDVYPLLKEQCFDCHAGENPDSGFRLDAYRELVGYSSGEILAEPGRSHHSRLIEVVTTTATEDRMPPDGADPLTDKQIAMLKAWIDQGMKWDDELLPPPQRKSDHWAFQAIVKPDIPSSTDTSWVRTSVDAFIQRAHTKAGVTHAAEAPKHTLVRRLYLDIIGLPPTPEQVDQFLRNESATAYEELVEQLLQSPHYGERWGRYWLDLARWAESQGFQHDIVRPYAWRYRDYVIDAFNTDKPYDRFLREQLAGDELQPYSDENLIATGFLGAARISGNQEDDDIQRNDVLVDIVNATGSAILGLTMECAQCHNHKFDPVSQRDYYRLQAFFVKGQLGNLALRDPDVSNPTDLDQWIPKPAYAFYQKEVKTLRRKKMYTTPQKPHTWGFLSAATGDSGIERLPVVNRKPIEWQPATLKEARAKMLIRGDVGSPGREVDPGWPEVLGTTPSALGQKPRSSMVDWMTDAKNPLVSRVWVNRLWQYHFGRGIVGTPSDFGVKGAEPTHPELLDWLASELMNTKWSTKHIHRQILLSSTYRQKREHHSENAIVDIDNKLLWQWPRRRLEAESIRDSVLVATGELKASIGGISIPPEREEQQLRRTIYLFQQRSAMPSVMEMFDAPAGISSCSRRSVSTVALQPLFMLNSQFMAKRAAALAAAVTESASDIDQQIDFAFLRTLSRKPDTDERQLARNTIGEPTEQSLMQLCHALLNLNEFVYIP